MLRVVLDTSVIVAAARSKRGASFRILELLGENRFVAAISPALFLEYEEVLRREMVQEDWTEQDTAQLLDAIAALTEHHETIFRARPMLRDPDDDFIVELALAAMIDYVVTHNVKDFHGSESVGVRVITPAGFLRMLADEK